MHNNALFSTQQQENNKYKNYYRRPNWLAAEPQDWRSGAASRPGEEGDITKSLRSRVS